VEVTGEEPMPRGRSVGALSPIRSARSLRNGCADANDCGRVAGYGFPMSGVDAEDDWRRMARPFSASFMI